MGPGFESQRAHPREQQFKYARRPATSIREAVRFMCAEKDPLVCHRAILVCRWLGGLGFDIAHIIDGQTVESQAAAE